MTPDEINALARRVMESGGENITPDEARELALRVGTLQGWHDMVRPWVLFAATTLRFAARVGEFPMGIGPQLVEQADRCPIKEDDDA